MKISINPLPDAKANAVLRINAHFANLIDPHRDKAHSRKKELATAVIAGDGTTDEFCDEAKLRGLTVIEFAKLILSKSDGFDGRELQRQQMLIAVEKAKSPAEINVILGGFAGR